MALILGAIKSSDTCFKDFRVSKAELHTSDVRAFYKVLRKLGDAGSVDAYYAGGNLWMKTSEVGEAALVSAQAEGHYSISLQGGPYTLTDPEALRQIFYSALRRQANTRGFRAGLRGARRKLSPEFDNIVSKEFVLGTVVDNVFSQGYTCFLEIRKDQGALLWVDPAISIFNRFKARFLSKAEISSANLTLILRRWSLLEPHARLAKARQFVTHMATGGLFRVEYADHTSSSFNTEFVKAGEVAK